MWRPHVQAGRDYEPLREALRAGDFEKADDITRNELIQLAGPGAVKRGWVYFTGDAEPSISSIPEFVDQSIHARLYEGTGQVRAISCITQISASLRSCSTRLLLRFCVCLAFAADSKPQPVPTNPCGSSTGWLKPPLPVLPPGPMFCNILLPHCSMTSCRVGASRQFTLGIAHFIHPYLFILTSS